MSGLQHRIGLNSSAVDCNDKQLVIRGYMYIISGLSRSIFTTKLVNGGYIKRLYKQSSPVWYGYSTAKLLSSRNFKLETYIEGATITWEMTTISPVFVGSTVINCKFRTCIIHCKAVAIVTSYLRNTLVVTSITRHVCFLFGVKVIIWLFTSFRSF